LLRGDEAGFILILLRGSARFLLCFDLGNFGFFMCRLFGVASVKEVAAEKYLLEVECSLYAQAVKGEQGDGWGVAWYDNGSPRIIKSEKPVYEERGRFEEATRRAFSKIIIAHVRKASNPRNLPREMIIGLEHTQPFQYGDRVFGHNGVIRIPDEVMEFLGDYRKIIKGNNDSEVYFALLMKEWDRLGDLVEALRSLEEILWKALRKSNKNYEHPFSSLNAIFSDGEKLYAYNRYAEEEKLKRLKSLCYGDTPYYIMTYLVEGDRLIVSSEILWKTDEWKKLGNGMLLTAWIEDGKLKHRVDKVL